MKSHEKRTVLAAAFVLVSSPAAAAAPQPLINYFKPMPIVGKLSTTVWGASAVGPRDPANGLEDNGANGGVGPQQETSFYWDGKILKGSDGKYHMYASHWSHSIGFGPPGGGSTGWETSIPMQAVSDSPMGPYVSHGDCYTKNQEGTNKGHNVTAIATTSATNSYILSVGEIVPGQMFGSSSPDGPWTPLGLTSSSSNGHSGCGDTSSNFTFTIGGDHRFWATSRGGCVMDSDQPLGPYKIETDSVLPNLEHNDNGDAEDECIWYSGGYFHIVYNYWNHQRGYHIMSKDGITNWKSTGLAYQGTQTPANAQSKWLRYTDGTVNTWYNMERVGVLIENGHPTHFTFAVTDTMKNTSAVNQGGSKVLVVPFDGVQFDCDNGDQASCDELAGADGGGVGSTGTGGQNDGGSGSDSKAEDATASGTDDAGGGAEDSGEAVDGGEALIPGAGDAGSGASEAVDSGPFDSGRAVVNRRDASGAGASSTDPGASGGGSDNGAGQSTSGGCSTSARPHSTDAMAWAAGSLFTGLWLRRRRARVETA